MGLVYKVVELSSVSDQEIESILNQWSSLGWSFDTMQFAMRESSRRPAMASICVTREPADHGAGRREDPER